MLTTLAFLLHRLALFCVMFVKEANLSDFDELGTLMLLGALMTAVSGFAVAVVYSRVDDSPSPYVQVISIKPPPG